MVCQVNSTTYKRKRSAMAQIKQIALESGIYTINKYFIDNSKELKLVLKCKALLVHAARSLSA